MNAVEMLRQLEHHAHAAYRARQRAYTVARADPTKTADELHHEQERDLREIYPELPGWMLADRRCGDGVNALVNGIHVRALSGTSQGSRQTQRIRWMMDGKRASADAVYGAVARANAEHTEV